MINHVTLVGRLTKTVELKYTTSNVAVASFTVAVDRPFTNQQTGERETDFIPCVLWRKQAENLAKYMVQGKLVGVEGRIQIRHYDDQNGNTRYVTEILCENLTLLDSKGSNKSNDDSQNNYQEEPINNDNSDDYNENDLPF